MSTDDRDAFREARTAGLRARHETREARAIRKQVAEEIALALEAYLPYYATDIFPEDGTSPDAIAAKAMRHAYPNAARIAREIGSADFDPDRWLDLNRLDAIKWGAKIIDALDAALPHLRPLFETATKVGLELGRKEAAEEIRQRIEKRRLKRRARWFRSKRWSAEAESAWSSGMWQAGGIAYRYARDIGTEETP